MTAGRHQHRIALFQDQPTSPLSHEKSPQFPPDDREIIGVILTETDLIRVRAFIPVASILAVHVSSTLQNLLAQKAGVKYDRLTSNCRLKVQTIQIYPPPKKYHCQWHSLFENNNSHRVSCLVSIPLSLHTFITHKSVLIKLSHAATRLLISQNR